MKAYSVGLRREIVEAVEYGMPKAEAACIFGAGISSVKRHTKAAAEEASSLSQKKLPDKKRKPGERATRLLEEGLHSRSPVAYRQRARFLSKVAE